MKRRAKKQRVSDLRVKVRLLMLFSRLAAVELVRQGLDDVARRVRHRRIPQRTNTLHRALRVGAGAGVIGLTVAGVAATRNHRHEPKDVVDASDTPLAEV